MKLAVIGTGLLGREIAIRLQDRRFAVSAWNRSPDKANALATIGIQPCATVGEAFAGSDAALLLLSDAAAIRAVLWPTDGSEQPALADHLLIQMGTIAPSESRALGRDVERAGGQYLEAPVLGSLPEARSGRLIVMAGGELGLYERCLPIFEALSEQPQRIGEVGQGAALKLAMNQLIGGLTATFAYSLGLVRDEGIDVEQFMGLLRQSALYAPTFDKKLDKYLSHEYGQANFPLKHLRKDIGLFRHVAEQSTMDTASLAALEGVFERAVEHGLGDLDYSALYEALVEGR
ncbi:NAD(P)-dependent oxidoreductase [Halochromatium sp.]